MEGDFGLIAMRAAADFDCKSWPIGGGAAVAAAVVVIGLIVHDLGLVAVAGEAGLLAAAPQLAPQPRADAVVEHDSHPDCDDPQPDAKRDPQQRQQHEPGQHRQGRQAEKVKQSPQRVRRPRVHVKRAKDENAILH